jgi:hypothetical protein
MRVSGTTGSGSSGLNSAEGISVKGGWGLNGELLGEISVRDIISTPAALADRLGRLGVAAAEVELDAVFRPQAAFGSVLIGATPRKGLPLDPVEV